MRQNIAFDLNVVAFTHQAVLPIAMDMVVDDAHRRSSADTGAVVEADFVVTEPSMPHCPRLEWRRIERAKHISR